MMNFLIRSMSLSTKSLILLGIIIAFISGLFATPVLKLLVKENFQEDYSSLVFKCDQAMREHFLAKSRVALSPNELTSDLLAQAEVALIDCQDYDMMRKQLLGYGLTEDDLGGMGLAAIEKHGKDIREIVRIHEIRF